LFYQKKIKIGLVAAEMSGDFLGAGLMSALKKQYKSIEFLGIGGPKMAEEGFHSLVPMEELSVMGITEVFLKYLKLNKIKRKLLLEFKRNPPDIFIGIDYPYFNLIIHTSLKKYGIKTVQYVSPKIWAWRQNRVFKIKRVVDLVLTLFPFENAFYDKHNVPAKFVGHPLADCIPMHVDSAPIKKSFGLVAGERIIAILPGSRLGELKYMAPLFLDVMNKINSDYKGICFMVAVSNQLIREAFEAQVKAKGFQLNIRVIDGNAQKVMALSELVILKSGTATLEAMLLKRPMIVAYKHSFISHAIIARQLKVPYIALPNLLANKRLVPEFLQSDAKATHIASMAIAFLDRGEASLNDIKDQFETIHYQLRKNASESAANAILEILD